jgi:hypothetical protein
MVSLTAASRRNKYATFPPIIKLLWICALSALPSGLVLYPWLLSIEYGQRTLIQTNNNNKEGGALDKAAVVTVGSCGGHDEDECIARWKEMQEKIQVERLITRSLMAQERERSHSDPYNRMHPELNQRQQEKDKRHWHEYLKENGATTSPFYGGGMSFPDINVVGFCKTGTSQLYHVFGTHQDVIYTSHKEMCTNAWENTFAKTKDVKVGPLDNVFHWHDYFYKERQSQPGKKTINGCMSMTDLQRRYHYNPPVPVTRSKFFLIFRDPAEWMWSVFNFFYDKHFEDRPEENAWVNATLHYRSPELFHEIFLAGQGKLHPSKYMFSLRDRIVRNARTVVAVAGRDNVIFLRNEDLQPQMVVSSGTLDRLSNITGLALDRFDPDAIHTKTNCNDNKSLSGKSCNDDDEDNSSRKKKGGYVVTHNRPMLEATRKLIYIQWHEECKVWAEEFGIVYPECLSAVPDEEENDTAKGNEKEETGAVPL